MLVLALAVGLSLVPQVDQSAYEGAARDDFAVWSFTSGQVTAEGDTRVTSVMARYVSPLQGAAQPIAYSVHEITFHCAARTADWSAGMNYAADNQAIGPGTASTAEAWSESTPGYIEMATQICSMDGSL
jgi:hypothetical protein